jgi:hypothetical protein
MHDYEIQNGLGSAYLGQPRIQLGNYLNTASCAILNCRLDTKLDIVLNCSQVGLHPNLKDNYVGFICIDTKCENYDQNQTHFEHVEHCVLSYIIEHKSRNLEKYEEKELLKFVEYCVS